MSSRVKYNLIKCFDDKDIPDSIEGLRKIYKMFTKQY